MAPAAGRATATVSTVETAACQRVNQITERCEAEPSTSPSTAAGLVPPRPLEITPAMGQAKNSTMNAPTAAAGRAPARPLASRAAAGMGRGLRLGTSAQDDLDPSVGPGIALSLDLRGIEDERVLRNLSVLRECLGEGR